MRFDADLNFDMDARLQKWGKWLLVIHDDIQQLVMDKHVFWTVQEIIKDNPDIQKGSYFYSYLGNTYVSHAVIGVRRQIKIDRQSISLARLLTEIRETPELLSRSYYCSLYKGSNVESWADRDFDNHCGKGVVHISPTVVQAELDELRGKARSCEELADRRIAHHDKRPPNRLPKFNELNECIETLDKLYVRYHLLLRAQSMKTLMPTFQYDWQEIFRQPWIKSDESAQA